MLHHNTQDYTVITAKLLATLIEDVRHLYDVGWKPLGGISVCMDPHSLQIHFYQAMTYASRSD